MQNQTKNKLPKREIKFRAWDKKEKFMFRNIDLNFISLMSDNGGIFMTKEEWGKKWFPNEREWRKRLVWMQYTGLKDKNGKEVYEGDIVKDEIGQIGVIEWDENIIGFNIKTKSGHHILLVKPYAKESLEVIGNIFENSDLLSKILNKTYEKKVKKKKRKLKRIISKRGIK